MKLEARIKKRLPTFQLDIDIQTEAAAIVLWGASGAGKTLTLNSLGGFTRPDEGRIMLGQDIFFDGTTKVHLPPQKRRCGYIFQEHALFPHMTIMENLSFAATASRQQSKTKIAELLNAFELDSLADRKPAQLSGGQQQRAALARAMVINPRMLLLDEPTQGLDARLKRNFFQLLNQNVQQSEALVVLVTHELDECFEMGDYICLLDAGQIIQSGPKAAVLTKPKTVQAARSLGIFNVIPAEIESLDPGRNLSRLRMAGAAWTGNYFPGHLLGDKGFATFRETSIKLSRNQSDPEFKLQQVIPFARGVRLELTGLDSKEELIAVVSESQCPRSTCRSFGSPTNSPR